MTMRRVYSRTLSISLAIMFMGFVYTFALSSCDRRDDAQQPVFVSSADDGQRPSTPGVRSPSASMGPSVTDGGTPDGAVEDGSPVRGDLDGGSTATGSLTGPRAPPGFEHIILRVGYPIGALCSNVLYEGNNPAMRGRRLPSGLYDATGETIAMRWRKATASARRVFVLRDALFSQQDHPLDHDAAALMMPPSWVTSALIEVQQGRSPTAPTAPPLEDNAAWARLDTPNKMFGSFTPSDALFGWARRDSQRAPPASRARIENARQAIRALAISAQAMVDAASRGPEAVASVGAEQIAASDRAYFGEALRRDHVIVISVENPNDHEVEDEGKGFRPQKADGSSEIVESATQVATNAILRRRLLDGDLALERYDLTQRADRRRAIDLLERLIPEQGPRAGPGHTVWLWVNGRLDTLGVRGEDATDYIEEFRAEVAGANINTARLDYVSKPHIDLPPGGPQSTRAKALRDAAARLRGLKLPLSVNLTTAAFLRLTPE